MTATSAIRPGLRAVLALAALALGGAVWLLWRGGAPDPEPSADDPVGGETEHPAAAAWRSGSSVPTGANAADGEPLREKSTPDAAKPAPVWVVQVLARETRAPVAGAMLYLDHYRVSDLTKEQRAVLDENVRQNQAEKNLEAFAPRTRTDAQGRATFARVKAGATCWALGGWYGSTYLAEDAPEPCVMLVDLDTVLSLQAVDTRGAPLSGPLSFDMQCMLGGETLRLALGAYVPEDSTEARIQHFATKLREAVDGRGDWTKTIIAVEATLMARVELQLPPLTGRDEVVRVLVPTCGVVRVRALGVQGPLPHGCSVSVMRRTADGGGKTMRAAVVNGVASFGGVGLGLRLQAWLEPTPRLSRPLEFAGPTREGEVVEVELRY